MKTSNPTGIRDLILNKRGTRTMETLSKDCGGIPSRANLDRIVNNPVLSWPRDNRVILGLAKGLGVRVSDIVTAYAASLGLPVEIDTSTLYIPGAGDLPETSRRIIIDTAKNMLWWKEQSEIAMRNNESNVVPGNFPAVDHSAMAASRGDDTERRIDPEQLPED